MSREMISIVNKCMHITVKSNLLQVNWSDLEIYLLSYYVSLSNLWWTAKEQLLVFYYIVNFECISIFNAIFTKMFNESFLSENLVV